MSKDSPREALTIAQREAERIGQVVKTLITQTQGPGLSIQRVAMNEVVESALLLLRQRLEGLRLEVDLARPLPPVKADANELRHVVLNLLSNAIDATPPGGRIRVSTRQIYRRDEPFVELMISDSGAGLDPDALAHIFEPFFTTKGAADRPGLGLAISRRIVEQHGGSIEAENGPDGGSRFTVLLPADRAA